jgi:acyl-CoA thioester hydrolase
MAITLKIDYNYPQMRASGYLWPVIDLQVRFAASARFGDVLKLRAEIVEWENRLKIEYLISAAATGKRLTRATTTQVAVEIVTGEMCFASPPVLFEKLGVARS